MSASDDNSELSDYVREARRALSAGDREAALESLMAAREAGHFQPALDDAVDMLRTGSGEEALEEVDERLAALVDDRGTAASADEADGDEEAPEREARKTPDAGAGGLEFGSSGSKPFDSGFESDDVAGRPDEDSTAREVGDSGSRFERDSSQVTAVGHESLDDRMSKDSEEGDREMGGASAEFDRLPSADLSSGVFEEAPSESKEEGDDDEISAPGEAVEDVEGRATERNPTVDDIAWEEMSRAEEDDDADGDADDGPGAFGSQGDVASSFLVEESDEENASHDPTPAAGTPAAAVGGEEGVAEGATPAGSDHGGDDDEVPDFDLGLDNPGGDDGAGIDLDPGVDSGESEAGDDESGARDREATPAAPMGGVSDGSVGAGLGEVSSAAREETSEPTTSGSDQEPLEEEAFFELAEELSSAESEALEESSASELREDSKNETSMARGPLGEEASRPTSSFDAAEDQVPPDASPSRELNQGLTRLMDEAETLLDAGEFDSAHDLVQSVLDQAPDSQEAQRLLVRIEQARARPPGDASSEETPSSEAVAEEEQSGESSAAGAGIVDSGSRSVPGERVEETTGGASAEEAENLSSISEVSPASSSPGSVPPQPGESSDVSVESDDGADSIENLDDVPAQQIAFDDISENDVDHRMGFLLSLVDGRTSFEDILDLSSMPREQTRSVLEDMLAKDIISVEED